MHNTQPLLFVKWLKHVCNCDFLNRANKINAIKVIFTFFLGSYYTKVMQKTKRLSVAIYSRVGRYILKCFYRSFREIKPSVFLMILKRFYLI